MKTLIFSTLLIVGLSGPTYAEPPGAQQQHAADKELSALASQLKVANQKTSALNQQLSQLNKQHSSECNTPEKVRSDSCRALEKQISDKKSQFTKFSSEGQALQMKLQLRMTEYQQEWSLTSQALQSLNQVMEETARAIKGQ